MDQADRACAHAYLGPRKKVKARKHEEPGNVPLPRPSFRQHELRSSWTPVPSPYYSTFVAFVSKTGSSSTYLLLCLPFSLCEVVCLPLFSLRSIIARQWFYYSPLAYFTRRTSFFTYARFSGASSFRKAAMAIPCARAISL